MQKLRSGGYCLHFESSSVVTHYKSWEYPRIFEAAIIEVSPTSSYYLPASHLRPDAVILSVVATILKQPNGGYLTLVDFGAGVGQYGRELEFINPGIHYRGYDGAGNCEEVTGHFVRWFDLTLPLSLRRADWLISLEVGEHISAANEMMVIRNLHSHNCRGVILSWAGLGQNGDGHVNNHRSEYLTEIFEALGYEHDQWLTELLRRGSADGAMEIQLRPYRLV